MSVIKGCTILTIMLCMDYFVVLKHVFQTYQSLNVRGSNRQKNWCKVAPTVYTVEHPQSGSHCSFVRYFYIETSLFWETHIVLRAQSSKGCEVYVVMYRLSYGL